MSKHPGMEVGPPSETSLTKHRHTRTRTHTHTQPLAGYLPNDGTAVGNGRERQGSRQTGALGGAAKTPREQIQSDNARLVRVKEGQFKCPDCLLTFSSKQGPAAAGAARSSAHADEADESDEELKLDETEAMLEAKTPEQVQKGTVTLCVHLTAYCFCSCIHTCVCNMSLMITTQARTHALLARENALAHFTLAFVCIQRGRCRSG